MDSHGLRSQIEGTKECVERAGQTVTDRVHDVLDRAKQSIEVGRQAYADSEVELRTQPTWLKGKSDRVASSIHGTIDGLNETVSSVELSVLEPFYELAALAKAFNRGAKRFFQEELPTVPEPSINTGQDAQTTNFNERFG
jgi:hypothetical protein